MKLHRLPFLLFLACFAVLFTTACGEEEVQDSLNYDGPNFTAPVLPGADVFAAYFPPSEVAGFEGRTLESVRFWVQEIPSSTAVVIYEAGANGDEPGPEIFRRDVTNRINVPSEWFTYRLNELVTVPAEGIWLGIEVGSTVSGRPIGCDEGTNYSPNGDRVLSDIGVWTSFRQITGSEEVNWNIRGFLADEE